MKARNRIIMTFMGGVLTAVAAYVKRQQEAQ